MVQGVISVWEEMIGRVTPQCRAQVLPGRIVFADERGRANLYRRRPVVGMRDSWITDRARLLVQFSCLPVLSPVKVGCYLPGVTEGGVLLSMSRLLGAV